MRNPILLFALLLAGCIRHPPQQPTREQEDTSIRFPSFRGQTPLMVGEKEGPYELDGPTLRALMVAANDFTPPDSRGQACWQKQEAHRYKVIREGGIIFVRIDLNPAHCKPGYIVFDYGVAYAINADGRILRRLYEGEPEDLSGPPAADAGELGPEYSVDPSRLGVIDAPVDCEFLRSLERSSGRKFPRLSESCPEDGGTPPHPSQSDGGAPPAPNPPDGGAPAVGPPMDGGAPPTQ